MSQPFPNLSDLAKAHSANQDQDKDKTNSGLSLDALAKSHLSNTQNSNQGFQIPDLFGQSSTAKSNEQFQIPNLFGASSKPKQGDFVIPDIFGQSSSVSPPKKRKEDGNKTPIDLMTALNLGKKSSESVSEVSSNLAKLEVKSTSKVDKAINDFYRQLTHFSSKNNVSNESSSSPFGRVMCRKWEETNLRPLDLRPKDKISSKITPFAFDTPSPDDVVLNAQSTAGFRNKQT